MLVLLRETFGYDRDLKSLVRSHLIERNIQIAKQQAEAKRLMASQVNFGVEYDESLKSID